MAKKVLIYLLMLFIFLPVISASVSVTISPYSKSFNLNHGKSDSVTFTINNDQSICPLNCIWKLFDESHGQDVDFGSDRAEAKKPYYRTFNLTAPTKEQAKQESGTIEYLFSVSCNEIAGGLFCDGLDKDAAEAPITLNYDLTPEEKQKRDYIKTRLEKLKKELESIETKEANINAKINSQPKNLLISDLKDQLKEYHFSYQTMKNSYNLINDQKENLQLDTAYSNINALVEIRGVNTINSYDKLKTDLDNRILLHNEIVDKVNKLSTKLNDLKELDESTKSQKSNALSNRFSEFKSRFEGGTYYTSYNAITQDLSSMDLEADRIKQELESGLKNLITEGINLLNLENGKVTSKITGNAISGNAQYSVNDFINICNDLNTIKINLDSENKNKINSYNQLNDKIWQDNTKKVQLNKVIDEVNNLSRDISDMINKNRLKDIDYSACKNSLSSFKEGVEKWGISYNLESFNKKDCEDLKIKIEEEIKKKDNKWNIFLFIQSFFSKLFKTSGYIVFAETKSIIIEDYPAQPVLEEVSQDSKNYLANKCNINLTNINLPQIKKASSTDYDLNVPSTIDNVKQNTETCCSFNKCEPCCKNNECYDDEKSYPIIFLHGHSFLQGDSPEYSLDAFNQIQIKLSGENYRLGGMILPDIKKTDYQSGEWGKVRSPITIKTTYYYNVYNSEGKLINAPSKQESIDEYARRLKNIVEVVKDRTNRQKVNIVAHSMGGLVARDYIKNYGGEFSVNKLIMIGTPNHGIYGQVGSYCYLWGDETECSQMKSDSNFISSLNAGDETYGNVKYYTIAGSGCILSGVDGDGISRVESVQLNGANNVKVNGKCGGSLNRDFHGNLLDPNKYPQTYDYIKQFLNE